jgi:hypothetical protein
MNKNFLQRITLTTGLLLVAAGALAANQAPSPHRKVDTSGVGNCVFSNETLPFQKDSSYKLKTQFSVPEPVYARCYFPKQIQDYKSLGSVYNSIRDDNRYGAELIHQTASNGFTMDQVNQGLNAAENGDQQAFDLAGTASSDFGYRDRAMAEREGAKEFNEKKNRFILALPKLAKYLSLADKKYPYTINLCVRTFVTISNQIEEESKYDSSTKKTIITKKPIYKTQTIAKGCFDYTIKKPEDVNWEPAAPLVPEEAKSLLKMFGI